MESDSHQMRIQGLDLLAVPKNKELFTNPHLAYPMLLSFVVECLRELLVMVLNLSRGTGSLWIKPGSLPSPVLYRSGLEFGISNSLCIRL